jgi:hypothetical protein
VLGYIRREVQSAMIDKSKRPKGCNRVLANCKGGYGYWLWEDGSLYRNGSIMRRNIDLRCGGDTDYISVRLCLDCLIKEGYIW